MFIDAQQKGYNVKPKRVLSEEHKKNMSLAKKESKKTDKGGICPGIANVNAKLTEEQAQYIIDNKGIIFQKDLAKALNVSRSTIEKIHRNTIWTHLPRK